MYRWPDWLPQTDVGSLRVREAISYLNELILDDPDPFTPSICKASWYKLSGAELAEVRAAYLAKDFVCTPITDGLFTYAKVQP